MKQAIDKTTALHILAIFAVVLTCYVQTVGYGFVTDDNGLLVANANVKSWDMLGRIFTTGYWDAEGVSRGLYRPLTILSFLVEYTFAGPRPYVYHLDNVLLHLLCAALVYLLLNDLFGKGRAAFYAALLFAAHPVHTEAVTWISGRSELLWSFFGLASILLFTRSKGSGGYPTLSVAAYLLALFSKEAAIVVPVMLAVWMLLFEPPRPGERRPLQLARRLWPYVAASAAFISLRLYVIGAVGPQPHQQALYGVSPYHRFLTMCRVLFEYIRLSVLPTGLGTDYLFPPTQTLLEPRVLLTLALAAVLLVLAPRIIRSSKTSALAMAWFIMPLLPVSNIIPIGILMSDRAMYMPSLGACMLMGAALASADRIFGERAERWLPAGALVLLTVLTLFIAGTIYRNPVWKDRQSVEEAYISYLKRNIGQYPGYTPLYRRLARVYVRFPDFGTDTEKAVSEAYARIGPGDFEMHEFMAYVYTERGMLEDALREMKEAIRLNPGWAEYYYKAAVILSRMNRYEEAGAMLDRAIGANPVNDKYRMLMGDMLMETGDDNAALEEYAEAARLDPANHDAFLLQGIILDSQRRFNEAIDMIRHAVVLRPDIPDLHYFLAVAYMDAGMTEPAKEELDEALRLRPGYREAVELRQRVR